MEVRKNDIVNGIIIDINDDGQGVLKTKDNQVIFVPNTITGENVTAQIINTKSKFAIAKVNEFISTSESRVTPKCKYFNQCGGCDIMHFNKQSQNKFKTQKVLNCFNKIGHINFPVNDCISTNDFRYRNKIAIPVSSDNKIGLYRKNTHSVLEITDCLITQEWNKNLIECINKYISQSKITCYNETTKSGLLKHIVARQINNKILVSLVVNGTSIPKKEVLIDLLKHYFNDFGLNININTLHNNVILSDKWKQLYGDAELIANECGIKYPVSNASFFQVNDSIKSLIYEKVLSLIDETSTVIDAYSGAGLLSAIISQKAKCCYGIEIIPEATENANQLKKANNLKNLHNINGDCSIELPKLIDSLKEKNIIVTLDPPRKGCDKKVLTAITKSQPRKIIYISCDPATLARDAEIIMATNNYKINFIQPYDMFPNTKHVETLISFEKI